MSEAYPQVPLAEVLSQYAEYIDSPEPKSYPKLSVRLYGKGVVLDTPTDGSTLRMKRHQLAKAGQVILSEIWGKKGAIGLVPPEGEGALCTSHFFLFDMRLDRIVPGYLQAIFTANYLQEQLDAEAKGTTGYAAVRPRHLLAAKIPLPTLDEQRRIVSRIEELAAKVGEAKTLRRESIGQLQVLTMSAAHRIWTDLASRFTATPILDVLDFEGGSQPPKHTFRFEIMPGYVRFLQIRDFSSDDYPTYIPISSRNSLVKPREVLVGRYGASLGKILRGKEGAYNVAMCKAVPKVDGIDLDFLAYSLSYGPFQERLREINRSAQAGFNKGDMREVPFIVPPPEEQRRVVAYLDDFQAKVDGLKKLQSETAAELDALIPSILSRAFRGEL